MALMDAKKAKKEDPKFVLPKDITAIIEGVEKGSSKEANKKQKKIKINQTYLSSKEAFELIMENYDDISFKPEILNYAVEFLTECYLSEDYQYVDDYLFNESNILTDVKNEIVNKILENKDEVLFGYYFERVFKDAESENFNYIEEIVKVLRVNPGLKPKDVREYYKSNLNKKLKTMSFGEVEDYYNKAKVALDVTGNNFFMLDLYNNFVIPSLQMKIKEMPAERMKDLEEMVGFIKSHMELKYNRTSRALLTAYDMLCSKGKYLTYDQDIFYDIQEVVERVLVNDKIMDYSLIYFCSYFDSGIDFKKALNLIVNISEGTRTLTLSKAKYQNVKVETIEESLNFLRFIIENYNKKTETTRFESAVRDFIRFNWAYFSSNNKNFLHMKSTLMGYDKLDFIIDNIQENEISKIKAWYAKNGAGLVSFLASSVVFLFTVFFGLRILTNFLDGINSPVFFIFFILAEIALVAFLIFMMMSEKERK